MAEKEERILIDVINTGINCVYRLDNNTKWKSLCKYNGNMEPVTASECRHCEEGMTRQEAIERMAKALRSNIVETQAQCSCLNMAEAALDALLGDK